MVFPQSAATNTERKHSITGKTPKTEKIKTHQLLRLLVFCEICFDWVRSYLEIYAVHLVYIFLRTAIQEDHFVFEADDFGSTHAMCNANESLHGAAGEKNGYVCENSNSRAGL